MRKQMTITVQERNDLVEQYLWCIDTVIHQNRLLLELAHLDHDDVYQDLAMRLIRAVAGFDPQKGQLKQHIFCQLEYELLTCKSAWKRYGFTDAPYDLRGAVVSVEALEESNPLWETTMMAA